MFALTIPTVEDRIDRFNPLDFLYKKLLEPEAGCDQRKKHLTASAATLLVSSVLQELKTDPIKLELAYRASKEKHQGDAHAEDAIRKNLLTRLQIVKDQQDTLTRRKDTPEDVYARNMTALKNEQVDLEVQLSKVGNEAGEKKITFEQVKDALLQANYQADAFFSSTPQAQREYVEIVLSNLSVKDQKVQHYQFKPAWQIIANLPKNATIEQLCPGWDSNPHDLTITTF